MVQSFLDGLTAALPHNCYLTEFIDQIVLENQLPQNVVNLLFTVTN